MLKKFYLDTCIWLDYFEDRKDGLNPLGEFAFQFLKKCEKQNCCIIVSDAVVFELQARLSKENLAEVFSLFRKIIIKVVAAPEQVSDARKEWKKRKKKVPFKDVLHAVIARDNNAVLVTRDMHFFYELSSIVEAKKPESIILD